MIRDQLKKFEANLWAAADNKYRRAEPAILDTPGSRAPTRPSPSNR